MRKVLLFIILCNFSAINAQSPGGIGTSDISFWYKGDSGFTDPGIDGGLEWGDDSTNSNYAFQTTSASEPSYTELINFNEAFTFDGTDDFFSIKNLNYTANEEIENLYGFVIYKSDFSGGNTTNNSFIGFGTTTGYSMALRGNGRLAFRYRDVVNGQNENAQVGGGFVSNDDTPHLASFVFEEANVTDTQIRLDGQVALASDRVTGNLIIRSNRVGFIGDSSNSDTEGIGNSGNHYDGEIAEIILIRKTTALVASELARIETHLALKYGITLDNTDGGDSGDYLDASGTVIWDASANAIYHHNVGGIINDTSGDVHQRITSPVGSDIIVSTSNDFASANSDLGRTDVTADTYLMFGDNNAPLGFSSTGISGKIALKRRWLFKESSPETNNVFIAVSEDLFPSGATVQLIISSDGVFDSETPVSLTNSGGLYHTTTAQDIEDGDIVSFLIDETKIAGVSVGKFDLIIRADDNSVDGSTLIFKDNSLGFADAVQDVIVNTPTVTNLMNYNPTITFDGTDDYLYIKNKHYNSGDEIADLHSFIVYGTDFNDGGNRTNSSFLDFDRQGTFSNYIRGDGRSVFQYRASSSNLTETGVLFSNEGFPHLGEFVFDGDAGGDDTVIKLDGALDDSDDKLPGNIILDRTRYGIIGNESNAASENASTRSIYYKGNISEILMTDTEEFTTQEVLQIQSYLALKYGITLDNSLGTYKNSQGTTVWDNITYWNGIAGIIRDDVDSDLDQRIAQSQSDNDIILATTADYTSANSDGGRTSLNNESFLIFGNNGGTSGAGEDNVTLGKKLTSRHWLFKEGGTNLNDNVHVAIPKSFFPDGSIGVEAVISTDGIMDGVGETTVALTDDGTFYHFSRDMDDGEILAFVFVPVTNAPGNIDTGLTMWLKSDQGVVSAGGNAESVLDASFNGNNISQTDNQRKPIYTTNEVNFNPTLTFSTDRMAIENLNYNGIGAIDKLYTWIIYKSDFIEEGVGSGIDDTNASFIDFDRREYFHMQMRGDGFLDFTYEDANGSRRNARGTAVTNTGTTQLAGFIFDNSTINETTIRSNGAVDFEGDLTSANIGTNDSGTAETRFGYIGDGSNAATFDGASRNSYYEGGISEIVYYEGETLDAVAINKIESYLAIKYGVTLSTNYITSAYVDGSNTNNIIWDITSDTNYNNDITVIGQDDDSSLNQKQSKSENSDGVLTISIDTSVADSNVNNIGAFDENLDFLAWGNNGVEDNFVIDCAAVGTLKVNKNWFVQNTGSVGAVTMQFDMFNISDPGNFDLVVDTDGNFTTTGDQTIHTAGSLSGTDLTFSSITLADGVYFTLFRKAGFDITYNGSWSGGSGTGGAPNALNDIGARVTIENSVTISEDFSCNCLKINSGQILTVPTGQFINANELILDGDLYLEGTAELIQTDDNTGNSGSGQLYKIIDEATASSYRYNFFSSPVNTLGNFNITSNFKFNTGVTLGDNTDPSFTNNLEGFGTSIARQWYHTLNNGTNFTEIPENTDLASGVGFTLKGTGSTNNYNFIGNPNNGEIKVPITTGNYLLTGNPYASTIDLEQFNDLNTSTLEGTVYLWDQPSGDAHATGSEDDLGGYATFTGGIGSGVGVAAASVVDFTNGVNSGSTEPSGFVKPGQGFVVFAEATGNVQFNNSLREVTTFDASRHFFKTSKLKTLRQILRLGFEYSKENGKVFHRQLATVLEGNSMEREAGKDAYMFDYFGNDAFWLLPNEEDRFVITSVPNIVSEEDDREELELPLGVVLDEDKEITFKIDKIENIASGIYLHDSQTNSLLNLKNNDFTASLISGEYNDRFSVIFRNEETLSSEETEDERNISLFERNGILYIEIKNGLIRQIQIYNFSGVEILNQKLNSKTANINMSDLSSKLYIAKIITNKATISKKISISK
ncbi:T9SS type A sorting domain-containing protein [Wenyingzhuangia sp. IMCC45533]